MKKRKEGKEDKMFCHPRPVVSESSPLYCKEKNSLEEQILPERVSAIMYSAKTDRLAILEKKKIGTCSHKEEREGEGKEGKEGLC